MSALRWALVGLSVTVAACSLVSLQGYSGGTISDDAASRPSDDASAEPEAAAPGDAGASGWCATHAPDARLCADFEDGGTDLFDDPVTDNGTIGVDTLASRSAPASLFAAAGARPDRVRAFLRTLAATDVTRAQVAFDLRVEGTHATTGAEVAHLKFTTATAYYTVGFGVFAAGNGTYAYEYSAAPSVYEENPRMKPFPLETWVRITLTADLPTKTVTLRREDDPTALTAPLAAPLTGPLDLELELGIAYSRAGEDGWKVRLDNIVFDAN